MEKIQKAYISYVLDKGEKPASVYGFAKKLKMTEGEFYDHYNSFEQLENEIWTEFFKETKQKIESEAIFEQYTVREKVLAFYFTWFEVLKANRSFVSKTLWLLDFWVKDTSKGFESTDTAIEKAVNTAFELIGTTVVDSVVDLAKFIYQNR